MTTCLQLMQYVYILKEISGSATHCFLNLVNWDDMGRQRPTQVIKTFFEPMQYVYHFKGNFSGRLGHILVFGCGQLDNVGRRSTDILSKFKYIQLSKHQLHKAFKSS